MCMETDMTALIIGGSLILASVLACTLAVCIVSSGADVDQESE